MPMAYVRRNEMLFPISYIMSMIYYMHISRGMPVAYSPKREALPRVRRSHMTKHQHEHKKK